MKPRTRLQKIRDQYDVYRAAKLGIKPKRSTRKDGGLPTKPVVPVCDLPESDVLSDCTTWLKARGFIADRMNVGKGDFGGGFRTYGIIGAGDIIVIAPGGRHIEVECKAGKGGVWSTNQQKRCVKIRRNNAVYMIIHGVEELEHRFEQEKLL
ncbi:hypothetical protein LCGC14_2145090 [marine sediment metagenome]|uniref:VRR-NUC domain-containing protein n=1 Tax=marine sediment metagenome TaxID=412755 RepID=A0A0F9GTK7_9ZZZZ